MKLLLLLAALVFTPAARATPPPYTGISMPSSGTVTQYLSGDLCVAASSATAGTCAIHIDGTNGNVTATYFNGSSGIDTTKVLKASDTMTGPLTILFSGATNYSLTVSSSIHILSGGVRWADGTFSTTSASGSGSGGVCQLGAGVNSVLCQGATNTAPGLRSVTSGGLNNGNSGQDSFIGGGAANGILAGTYNVLGGGNTNQIASGSGNTITGGALNSSTGGGDSNVIAGGATNTTVNTNSSVIGGGAGNTHTSSFLSVIGGGDSNHVSGNFNTVPGGSNNAATGTYSFAAGRRAKANAQGAFTLADSTNADFINNTTDTFKARFTTATFSGDLVATRLFGNADNLTFSNRFGWVKDSFLAQVDGAQTTFVLSAIPTNGNAVTVVLDGLIQSASDYTFTPPTTVTMTTAPAANSYSFFMTYSTGVIAGNSSIVSMSSYTVVPAGSTSQISYSLAFATVTLSVSGVYDLEVTLSCSGDVGANNIVAGWSLLYDGLNNKFGLGATTGIGKIGGTDADGDTLMSGTFPIGRGEVTAGAHTFALSFASEAVSTVVWPATFGGLSTACRWGVKEVH